MAQNTRGSAKKQQQSSSDDVEPDTTKPVLGGMKGGYRMTGDEETPEGTQTFDVAFGEKSIICQQYNTITDGKDNVEGNAAPALIFTHGAGGGINNPATVEFAQGFATVSPVLCFQGTMNLQSRIKSFKAVIEQDRGSAALGGRSMGARAAVLTAQEHEQTTALVLVSYPLTSQKKGDSREGIILDLTDRADVLFVIGDRDTMCDLEMLNEVRSRMKAKSWLVVVKGADHSMSGKPKEYISALRKRTGILAAQWLIERPSESTECNVHWDEEQGDAVSSAWSTKSGSEVNVEGTDEQKGSSRKRRKKA